MNLRTFLTNNLNIIGAIAALMAIVMVLASIEILISNLKGHSHVFIQPISMALNGLVWSLYAYAKKDNYIFIPNILSFIIGTVTAISAFI